MSAASNIPAAKGRHSSANPTRGDGPVPSWRQVVTVGSVPLHAIPESDHPWRIAAALSRWKASITSAASPLYVRRISSR